MSIFPPTSSSRSQSPTHNTSPGTTTSSCQTTWHFLPKNYNAPSKKPKNWSLSKWTIIGKTTIPIIWKSDCRKPSSPANSKSNRPPSSTSITKSNRFKFKPFTNTMARSIASASNTVPSYISCNKFVGLECDRFFFMMINRRIKKFTFFYHSPLKI